MFSTRRHKILNMNFYRIADLNVILQCEKTTERNAKKYLSGKFEKADIEIVSTKHDIEARASKHNLQYDNAAYLIEGQEFYIKLLDFNGIYLHASAVVVDGLAYLFSAPSGTGKSTHTEQWLKLFGERAFIINDDKPAVRVLNDGIFVFGTPWSGKHDISVNTKAKLQGICFLERGEVNEISIMPTQKAIIRLLHASLHKLSKENMQKELAIISTVIENVPIYQMKCLPDIDSAKISYEIMSKKELK